MLFVELLSFSSSCTRADSMVSFLVANSAKERRANVGKETLGEGEGRGERIQNNKVRKFIKCLVLRYCNQLKQKKKSVFSNMRPSAEANCSDD